MIHRRKLWLDNHHSQRPEPLSLGRNVAAGLETTIAQMDYGSSEPPVHASFDKPNLREVGEIVAGRSTCGIHPLVFAHAAGLLQATPKRPADLRGD